MNIRKPYGSTICLISAVSGCGANADSTSEGASEAVSAESASRRGIDTKAAAIATFDFNAKQGDWFVGGSDLGSGVHALNNVPDVVRAGSVEELSVKKAIGVAAPDVEDTWRTELSVTDSGDPNRLVPIIITMNDVYFPWHHFRDPKAIGLAKDNLIILRQQQMAKTLDALEAKLAGVGATGARRFWVIPSVAVIVPVSSLVPEQAIGKRLNG